MAQIGADVEQMGYDEKAHHHRESLQDGIGASRQYAVKNNVRYRQ